MSKNQIFVKKVDKLKELLDDSIFGTQFITYLENRALNSEAVWDDMTNESIQAEFVTKCEWIQHYAKIKLNTNVTMEIAAAAVNESNATSFSKSVSENIFDGFMHFVVANETNSKVLSSLIKTWVAQGRSLTELDSNKLTPLQVSVYTKNMTSFIELAKAGVEVTEIDGDGLSPLHVIVNKIEDGSADISLLEAWVNAELPTDMVSSKHAKKWAGKTAVEFAEMKGLVEATRLLGGDVDLSYANSDEIYQIQRDLILQSYSMKVESDSKAKTITETDKYKLLSHYLVENYSKIKSEIFARILIDEEIMMKTNIVIEEKTILEKCVELGYNDWALQLAKVGVGSVQLDNGLNIINYCVYYNNDKLLDEIIDDTDLDITSFESTTRECEVSDGVFIAATPLLQAVKDGKVEMLVKLAKLGFGTTSLDNTNHVLNYVNNFGGSKKIEMAKALATAKIDVSNEKAEQALVGALYPNIDTEYVAILVQDLGVATEGALTLFATNKLLPQVECLVMNGAEVTSKVNEILISNGIDKEVDEYVLARKESELEIESSKPMKSKEKLQFILEQVAIGASEEEMVEAYSRKDEIGKRYIDAFKQFKITQAEKPVIFKKICDIYKVVITESEEGQVDVLDLLVDTTSGSKEEESAGIVEILGQDGGSDD